MKKILFVYDHVKPEQLKDDGLWSALKLLEEDFEITKFNLANSDPLVTNYYAPFDFVLGWGGFDSRVDKDLQKVPRNKKGLCLAAQFPVNKTARNYDVIFYETEHVKGWLEAQGVKTKLVHAFGINTDIFRDLNLMNFDDTYPKIWDNVSVGSFSKWHRQDLLYDLPGYNLAVGNIQGDNIQESFNYVANLLLKGWTVSNFVPAETLAKLYNISNKVYLTAEFGQERACLEARACGLDVVVPEDNPKLKELQTSPIWDVKYYAEQLKKGILECL